MHVTKQKDKTTGLKSGFNIFFILSRVFQECGILDPLLVGVVYS